MKKAFFGAAALCAAVLAACGGGDRDGIRIGSLSGEFDSLSYALGANIGYGIERDLSDIPFDYDRFDKGMKDGALDRGKVDRDRMMAQLREYFLVKRMPRLSALQARRAEADSIRRASGDTTEVKYGSDASLFASDGERDSISYAFGNNWGYSFRISGAPVQIAWVLEAMKDVREGKARMTEQEKEEYIRYYFLVKLPAENAKASEEWLAEVASRPGVHKTESGLLYRIEKQGDTVIMARGDRDRVSVHYKGMNRKGKVFDASRYADKPAEAQEMLRMRFPDSYDKDEPVEFPLGGVIPGWSEGVKLVGKGGKITLWIPSDLAYGPRGAGRVIGPNEALEFEIEVVDVTPYLDPADTTDMVDAAEIMQQLGSETGKAE